ncbi:MAG TPA: exo-alpha-sialidase, partial [Methylomirabilota bacterium]|nr:exo-alpha-sialidase [Methylomirabilota bacterium]
LLPDGTLGTDASHVGLHPDQHAFAVNPNNPNQFFEGSDGGLMRSNGTFTDISSRCDSRGLAEPALSRCKQLLSRAPTTWTSLNNGLQTLQFQSLSVNPANAKNVQGGTQDNGTFETTGSSVTWPQTIFGDGGLSGFDPTNPAFRFHTYFDAQIEVNFNNGAPPNWDWISDSFFIPPGSSEGRLFYLPVITDPAVHGTMFAGLTHVWRTKDDGGPQADLDVHCNRFTGDFTIQCGDWEFLDGATLTSSTRGTRSGGAVGWISRTSADNSTLWASTTTGRLFISKNANADPASAVTFTRLDTLDANAPNRAISSISIDPANPNHAYVSYLSYNQLVANLGQTPVPGHVFSVTYDPTANSGAGGATWVSLDGSGNGAIGNQPVNGVAFDPVKGDLYAATDFGVVKLAGANAANGWTMAAPGLPVVTAAGLTINPGARQLLAATHGRGAYQLTLP